MSRANQIGSTVVRLNNVDSTNAYIKRNAATLTAGTVVLAEHQTAGRGRMGREWIDSKGKSLLFSVLCASQLPPRHMAFNSLWPAIAVVDALSKFGVNTALKWPNDILCANRKIGGVLVESVSAGRDANMVVGIGINYSQSAQDFPESLVEKAGSIHNLTGIKIDREDLLQEVINQLNNTQVVIERNECAQLQQKWLDKCCHLNKKIELHLDDGIFDAIFVGIDEHGFALVKKNDQTRRITSCVRLFLKDEICC